MVNLYLTFFCLPDHRNYLQGNFLLAPTSLCLNLIQSELTMPPPLQTGCTVTQLLPCSYPHPTGGELQRN